MRGSKTTPEHGNVSALMAADAKVKSTASNKPFLYKKSMTVPTIANLPNAREKARAAKDRKGLESLRPPLVAITVAGTIQMHRLEDMMIGNHGNHLFVEGEMIRLSDAMSEMKH